MLPGMLMSVKTIRMSFLLSRSAMASSALPASSTPKPASSRRDTAFIRTRNSSSTTSTSGRVIKHQGIGPILHGPVDRTLGSEHLLLTPDGKVCSELHSTLSFRNDDARAESPTCAAALSSADRLAGRRSLREVASVAQEFHAVAV